MKQTFKHTVRIMTKPWFKVTCIVTVDKRQSVQFTGVGQNTDPLTVKATGVSICGMKTTARFVDEHLIGAHGHALTALYDCLNQAKEQNVAVS